MARHRILRIPIVRGVVALGESLAIGFRALSVSANYAAAVDNPDEAEDAKEAAEIGRWTIVASFVIAIGFALALFKVGPGLLADTLPISNGTVFVIVEAAIRISIFVGYLAALSLYKPLRRVFEYHAAEHKAINAYEAGEELTPEVAQRYSLIHPRCGTSFLFWVVVLSVFVYAPFGRLSIQWHRRQPHRRAALHRRGRLRADPVRRQARPQPRGDDAARARTLAAAADDARADARPARGLDPGPPRGPGSRGPALAGGPTSGGDGVSAPSAEAAYAVAASA